MNEAEIIPRRLVIAWDSTSNEFDDLLVETRAYLGLVLVEEDDELEGETE